MADTDFIDQFEDPIEAFPTITDGLLKTLRFHFPRPKVGPSGTEREDVYHAGQQSVITKLEDVKAWQEDPDKE